MPGHITVCANETTGPLVHGMGPLREGAPAQPVGENAGKDAAMPILVVDNSNQICYTVVT